MTKDATYVHVSIIYYSVFYSVPSHSVLFHSMFLVLHVTHFSGLCPMYQLKWLTVQPQQIKKGDLYTIKSSMTCSPQPAEVLGLADDL